MIQERQIGKPGITSTGLEQADYERAVQQIQAISNRYYKGEEVKGTASLPHFKMYGVGIYLFFSFLKHVSVLLVILTIISAAPIIVNGVKGSNYRHSQTSLNMIITKSSLGSHRFSIMNAENAYSLSISFKIVNVSFDIIGCILYLIFFLYWERKSKTIEKHISKEIKLQSALTVEIDKFPENVKESDIQNFMRRFGRVTEVVAARDFTEEIRLSKNIYEIQVEIKQLQFEDRSLMENKHANKIQELMIQRDKLLKDLENIQTRKHQITKFYVQYESPQDRKRVINKFHPYQRFCQCRCCRKLPEEIKHSKMPHIADGRAMGERTFYLENENIKDDSPSFYYFLIIVGGFIFISFLNIVVPYIETDIDTSRFTYQQIKFISVKNPGDRSVEAWCIKNFQFDGQNSPYNETCRIYWQRYIASTVVSISISIIVMILCQIIKKVVYALAQFQRYTTLAQKSVTIMTNLFIMDFLTTTLITFLMRANIFSLSVLQFLKMIVKSPDLNRNIDSYEQFKDLSPAWYKEIGYQIWFNIFVMCFLPHLYMPVYYYVMQCFCKWQAKKQMLHRKMVERLTPSQFQIQDHYANVLLIISTGFIFGGGMQIMMVVILICLAIRYFYWKYIFIRFCRVPNIYNQILNDRLVTILKAILLLRCLISLYMYGADDVFAMEKSTFMKWASQLEVPFFKSVFVVLSRAILTWYYSMFVVIIIIVLIFKQFIISAIKKCKKSATTQQKISTLNTVNETVEDIVPKTEIINDSKQLHAEIQEPSYSSWKSNQQEEKRSQRMSIKSYRLENNPLYAQILIIMKLRLKKNEGITIQNLQPVEQKRVNTNNHKIMPKNFASK